MMGEMGDVAVPREELGSRRAQLFARLAEAERLFPNLFLQNVETLSHLAELVTRVRLDRHDVDRSVGSLEIAAAQGSHGLAKTAAKFPRSSAWPPC